jgi:hypothetical protein
MSTLAVLLYAGVTTLTAAIVTLFTAGMAAGSMERRSRKRRYRQLEGPVPGRRGLSDVALKAEADGVGRHTEADGLLPPPMPASHEPAVPAQAPRKPAQGLPAAASAAQGTPPANPPKPMPAQGQQAQPARKKPVVSILMTTPDPDPQSGAPSDAGQPSPIMPDMTSAASADAMADLDKFLKELEIPAGGLAGDAAARDDSQLDIFAGLDEPEMAAVGLDDDLNGIDGGGLPTPTPKTPQKSRR